MVRKSQRLQKAYRKQYYKQNKDEESKDEQSSVSKEIRKARNREAYEARIKSILGSRKKHYALHAEDIKQIRRERYQESSEKEKDAEAARYASQSALRKEARVQRYRADPREKTAPKQRYEVGSEKEKTARKQRYEADPREKTARKQRYEADSVKEKTARKQRYEADSVMEKTARKQRYEADPREKTARKQRYEADSVKEKTARKQRYEANPVKEKTARKQRYQSHSQKEKQAERVRYLHIAEQKKTSQKLAYRANPDQKKTSQKLAYRANPDQKKALLKQMYKANPQPKKAAEKKRYHDNPEPKKASEMAKYKAKPQVKLAAQKKRYKLHSSSILFKRRCAYYLSASRTRASKLVHRAVEAVNKKARTQNAHYSLKEPKLDVQELYVKNMRQTVACNRTLKRELTEAFKTSHKALASKLEPSALSNAVAYIAVRRILNTALNSRKQSAGYFLACVRSISNLQLSKDGFGEKYHTPSSEPYYYDQSYAQVEHKAAIPVDSKGRCIVAGVIERAASGEVQKWRCTAECKLPNTEAQESIVALKGRFDESRIPDLRWALDRIDSGCSYQHFSTPYTRNQKGKREYDANSTRDFKGHPLPCAQEDSGCPSTLRMLRAAAPHYPRLRKLLQYVYEALRLHRFINDIDVSLCNGDFEQLCLLLGITNYAQFLGPGNDSADHYSPENSGEAQAVLYQQPNLPDREAYLHVQYAEVISKLENKMADDPEFPCCSCERLMQRKQVTAFKFSDSKFCSNMWENLKDHISKENPNAGKTTHYVCCYCRV